MKFFALLALIALQVACTSVTPKNNAVKRKVADDADTPPPLAQFHNGWAFTWTNSPRASQDPRGYIEAGLEFAQQCLPKIAANQDDMKETPNCEGDGKAQGPGIYTCDNPFTTHDYGKTLVMVPLKNSGAQVSLATGRYTLGPASGSLEFRPIYKDASRDAIIYDFNRGETSVRAMVVRDAKPFDLNGTVSIDLVKTPAERFGKHVAFACDENTSLPMIVQNWADQIEFMSLIYRKDEFDPDENFVKGGSLNHVGAAAALASDVVALTPYGKDVLAAYPYLKNFLKLEDCQGNSAENLKTCLARRIFDTLLQNKGTANGPTVLMSNAALVHVMEDVGLVAPKDAHIMTSPAAMLNNLAPLYSAKTLQGQRALQAYTCVQTARQQIQAWTYNNWGDDPQ